MEKLYLGLGEQLDIFFVMENGEITKVFYDEDKCIKYINDENKRRENEQKNLFN